ncbi:MAG: DUF2887 domain-containing protein [Cyanobacteria bacterium J06649_5]
MRRDSIFYSFFQRSPTFIFDLLPNPPANVADYRFDSVSVKEAKFEMDGVFLPPDNSPGTVYFCEVQMQKIKTLYERIFAEGFLYFYRNRSRFTAGLFHFQQSELESRLQRSFRSAYESLYSGICG